MLENEQEDAIHRLGVLLGREPDAFKAMLSDVAPIPGGGDPDSIAVRIPAGLPSDLLRRRPDIRGAEREIAAATARVGVATADLFPKFYITGNAGLESISVGDFFFATSRMWTVGPSMTWRIFSAGRIRATIAARNAQEEQALYNYRKTVLCALAEVEDALVAYGKQRTRHEALLSSAHAFKQSAMLARDRYELLELYQCARSPALALYGPGCGGAERSTIGQRSDRLLQGTWRRMANGWGTQRGVQPLSSDHDWGGRLIAPTRGPGRTTYSGGAAPWRLKPRPFEKRIKISRAFRVILELTQWKSVSTTTNTTVDQPINQRKNPRPAYFPAAGYFGWPRSV